ncbi:MAG: hypothetical protein U9P49_11635, partial [Thermodesulfobacteriota bacterium]|nr:hypothetical protein [Thermodesulfobacteriota bacterium]
FYTYWVEFPEDHPFRFGLYRQEILDCEKSLIFTQNVYVRRDGFIDDSKKEITRFYSLEALENLLGSKGFRNIKVAANFNNAEYIEGKSERLVLLALRI